MGTTTKTLYDTDFVEWTERAAALLRERRFDEVDLDHVVEEIEDLGRNQRSAIESQLRRMLKHMVKQRIQPERTGSSWRSSIVDARAEIDLIISNSPSLRRFAQENLQKIYAKAVSDALTETKLAGRTKELKVPAECPYVLDDLLEGDLP